MPTFTTVLIANRGEIACRILRSVHALGYRSVAVYSEAEEGALHVRLADRAVCIGPPPVRESYLVIERLIDAARRTGADAIHPGYGFLSENEAFAEACAAAGIVFIGPPPPAIRAMGNKAQAKIRMIAAGVPCVPGYQGDGSPGSGDDARLLAEAERIGLPLLVKAAAGGGGRGMRLVQETGSLAAALRSARAEALSAFGSDEVILERALTEARHVELQVFADAHGHTLHLGERECSVQRRHQKIIEEAPSPAVDPALRARMGAAAVQAAAAIGYVGAGTVEFLLDRDGSFYFLEMNTRLQVEHPVTEEVTGLDLVALQLRVAAGAPLPITQDEVTLRGHAIEARLYAEDPYAGFLPQSGTVGAWSPATGEGVRVDHGLAPGQPITPHYDPMVAKVIAWGEDREEARRRLDRALAETVLLGPTHNKRLLQDILAHPVFVAGDATTRFIDRDLGAAALARPALTAAAWALAGLLWALHGRSERGGDGWRSAGDPSFPLALIAAGVEAGAEAALSVCFTGEARARISGVPGASAPIEAAILEAAGPRIRVRVDGIDRTIHGATLEGALHLEIDGASFRFAEVVPRGADDEPRPGDGKVRAPTGGRLLALPIEVGARVEPTTIVAVLESMKIETSMSAGVAGIVEHRHLEPGAQVKAGALLVTITPDDPT
ncbi:MAG: biotin carboxylase N-terminal domain-containing protein [Nannocystaceae bacterium]